ncbi:type II secretion system protein N [Agaribacterium haliotis]|uniref:type II secretion system protein N n=1 Tax=Agaribacterium haliotis TaxID=2013869 RepID=UPI000BB58DB3|nr:type II secretion system protein N [Agaribacterium haliotis]
MNYKNILKLPLALFLVLYFLYLVVSSAPAAWAAWAAHKAVPNLWLNSVEGSLWSGKAQSAQVDIGPESFALGALNWQLNPWTLLILKPCVDFSASLPNQQLSGSVCHGLGGTTELSDLNIDLPLSVIKAILPMPASGSVSVQVLKAKFDKQLHVEQLAARGSWQKAKVHNGETWMSFGSFAANAEADGQGGVSAKIFDLEGPYKSDFTASWAMGKDASIAGTVAPQNGADQVIIQGLQILGEDLGDGSYRVQWP